jgi:hypothetical protein
MNVALLKNIFPVNLMKVNKSQPKANTTIYSTQKNSGYIAGVSYVF